MNTYIVTFYFTSRVAIIRAMSRDAAWEHAAGFGLRKGFAQ